MASRDSSPTSIEDRVDRLENLVERQQETIEQQQELIEKQQEQLEEATDSAGGGSEDGGLVASKFSRRSLLQAAGVISLAGYGTGVAAADPQGQVGTSTDPLRALYSQELNGGVTGDQSVTSLTGTGLSVDDETLSAADAAGDHVDVADSGSSVVEDADEIEFDAQLSASDDGDGTATVDFDGITVENGGGAVRDDVTLVDFDDNLDVVNVTDGEVRVNADSGGGGGGGGGAPTGAQYVTLSTDGTLTDERTLNGGSSIRIADNGAGNNVDVIVDPPNDTFITATNAAGTDNAVNLWKANTSDNIEAGNKVDLGGNQLIDSTSVTLGNNLDVNGNNITNVGGTTAQARAQFGYRTGRQ